MFLYNTVCEVILFEYPGDGKWILDQCEKISVSVQNMLNIFDETSELSVLNREYVPEKWFSVSEEMFQFLQKLMEFSALSEGAYDPTVGALVRLWNFRAEHPVLPSEQDILRVKKNTGYKNIRLDKERKAVSIAVPGMVLDAGGAGKGYAVGLAAEWLKRCGVTSASINYGGNLYLLGEFRAENGEKRSWRVGVQKPWAERGQSIGMLFLKDQGVATSAGYDRYFELDGKRYQHIIHPFSGCPVESEILSVSIVSESPLITDLMSTAFFVAGISDGEKIAKRLRKQGIQVEYVVILQDKIHISDGIKEKFLPYDNSAWNSSVLPQSLL